MDYGNRLPSQMGVLAVECLVRLHGLPMVQLFADYGTSFPTPLKRMRSSNAKLQQSRQLLTYKYLQISEVTVSYDFY